MPRLLGRDGIRKRPKASEMLDSLLALGGLVLLRGEEEREARGGSLGPGCRGGRLEAAWLGVGVAVDCAVGDLRALSDLHLLGSLQIPWSGRGVVS